MALQAIAARVTAPTARAAAQAVDLDAQGVAGLDGLDGCVAGVGHVHLEARRPRAVRPAAAPAAEGLVVGEGAPAQRVEAADRHVVHRALARGRDPVRQRGGQRAEDDVDDPLAGLDVAGGDRGGRAGVEQRAEGGDDAQRREGAGVDRCVAEQAGDGVVDRGFGDGEGGVDPTGGLRGRAAEVRHHVVPVDRHGHRDLQGPRAAAVVVEPIGMVETAVRQRGQQGTGAALAVGQERVARGGERVGIRRQKLGQPLVAHMMGGELGLEVAPPLVGRA